MAEVAEHAHEGVDAHAQAGEMHAGGNARDFRNANDC